MGIEVKFLGFDIDGDRVYQKEDGNVFVAATDAGAQELAPNVPGFRLHYYEGNWGPITKEIQ